MLTPTLALIAMMVFAGASFFFALAHYQTLIPAGEVLDANSFQFRLAAGLFFGLLFWHRGFGIAVGTHAIYDLMVGLQQV